MKYVSLLLLSCVVAATIIYGVGAFITWDANPGNWSTPDRFIASIFWLVVYNFAMYTAVVLTED